MGFDRGVDFTESRNHKRQHRLTLLEKSVTIHRVKEEGSYLTSIQKKSH